MNEKCSKLEDKNLNDKCYYRSAVINYKNDYCDYIIDQTLKQDCELQTVISSESGVI